MVLNLLATQFSERRDDPDGLCTWLMSEEIEICLVRARGTDPIRWGCSAAMLSFASAEGIDGASIQRWTAAMDAGLPALAVVAGLDDVSSDFDESAAIIRRISESHAPAEPIIAPLLADDESVAGFLDLLGMRIWVHEDDQEVERACDPEHLSVTSDARQRLVESILLATTDDAAVQRAIDESLDPVSISALMVDCVRAGEMIPVLGWGGPTGAAIAARTITELLPGGSGAYLPAVMSCDGGAEEPISTSGRSFATPVGSMAMRVWSGTFATGDQVSMGCALSAELSLAEGFTAEAGRIVPCQHPLPDEAARGISSPGAELQLMTEFDQHD
jgi:translation elongation factor EF-G